MYGRFHEAPLLKFLVLRFTHAQRLTHKSQFDAVYKGGRRISDSYFTMVVRPNAVERPRLGLSIAARSAGGAVNRNRIKRVIRESFRFHQDLLPAVDVVVSVRPGAREADNRMLADKLARCWREVIARCAAH